MERYSSGDELIKSLGIEIRKWALENMSKYLSVDIDRVMWIKRY